jgi:hypothetical protein
VHRQVDVGVSCTLSKRFGDLGAGVCARTTRMRIQPLKRTVLCLGNGSSLT